jgi:hypothetical protein
MKRLMLSDAERRTLRDMGIFHPHQRHSVPSIVLLDNAAIHSPLATTLSEKRGCLIDIKYSIALADSYPRITKLGAD